MSRRLAHLALAHRRLGVAAWIALVVAGVVAGAGVFDRLDTDGLQTPPAGSESDVAARRLAQATAGRSESLGDPELYAVLDQPAPGEVARVVAALEAVPGVDSVGTLDANDGAAAAVGVQLLPRPVDLDRLEHILRSADAREVLVGGDQLLDDELGDQAEHDLQRAEMLSFPVLLVLLFVLFGGLV